MKRYLCLLVLCGAISSNGFAMQEGSSKSEKVAEASRETQSGQENLVTQKQFKEEMAQVLCAIQKLNEKMKAIEDRKRAKEWKKKDKELEEFKKRCESWRGDPRSLTLAPYGFSEGPGGMINK